MTVLDWGLIVVWFGLTLGGFWKGAVRIVFGGGGLVAGVWLAVVAGSQAEAAMSGIVGVQWLAASLARMLLVVLCAGLCLLAGWGIEKTLNALHLGWLNRLFGAVLVGLVAAILLGFLVVIAIQFSPELAQLCAESTVAQHLLGISIFLLGAV